MAERDRDIERKQREERGPARKVGDERSQTEQLERAVYGQPLKIHVEPSIGT